VNFHRDYAFDASRQVLFVAVFPPTPPTNSFADHVCRREMSSRPSAGNGAAGYNRTAGIARSTPRRILTAKTDVCLPTPARKFCYIAEFAKNRISPRRRPITDSPLGGPATAVRGWLFHSGDVPPGITRKRSHRAGVSFFEQQGKILLIADSAPNKKPLPRQLTVYRQLPKRSRATAEPFVHETEPPPPPHPPLPRPRR